jgi:hypothetical protein
MPPDLSSPYADFRKKTFATAALVALLLLTADGVRAQIAIGGVSGGYSSDLGPKKFHRYVVFIEQPGRHFTPLVTKPATGCPTYYAPLLTTYDWAQQAGAFVAINASFGDPEQEYKPGDCRYVFGPVKSSGVLVAPSITRPDGQGNPAILFAADGTPSIKMATKADVAAAYNVVSGQWEQNQQLGYNGSLLIKDGALLGASALPEAETPNPRTAVGLTRTGTLILAMIEGRLPDSDGITLPALALLLQSCGAYNAINLDGGGSSTITYLPDPRVQMKESSELYNLMKASWHDDSTLYFGFTQHDPRVPFASRPINKIGQMNVLYRPVTIHFGFTVRPALRK